VWDHAGHRLLSLSHPPATEAKWRKSAGRDLVAELLALEE
jgi:hypothetical protein